MKAGDNKLESLSPLSSFQASLTFTSKAGSYLYLKMLDNPETKLAWELTLYTICFSKIKFLITMGNYD
jgi:hypothetical protein